MYFFLTTYVFSYWSTESGSPITAIQLNSTFPPLSPRPGSAGLPLPGMDLQIVDDDGKEIETGQMGNIVLGTPLPPSALGTVWQNEGRYQEAYFDRFRGKGEWYDTGDAGVRDEQGFISVLSRADDLIKCVVAFLQSPRDSTLTVSLRYLAAPVTVWAHRYSSKVRTYRLLFSSAPN